MNVFDIQYNGETGHLHGITMYDYPEIAGGEKRYTETSVAGRIGDMVGKNTGKSNLQITCVFSLITNKLMLNIRQIKKWLSGTGMLSFSDDVETVYKVLKINYGSIERELRSFGRFTVVFTCVPFEYQLSGFREHTLNEVLFNPCSECFPTYIIAGEGVCTLTVNGKTFTANVGQKCTIDTELMLSYREDGDIMNSDVTGYYEDLHLKPGANTIIVTDGFDVKIIPKWGYEV